MYPNENDLKPRIAAIRLICRVKWVLLQDIKRVSYIVTVQSDVPHFYADAALWTERSLYYYYIILI